ncbi:MAG: hypothetical protein FJ291_27505 [Planctomycetes bacterium]|nr:hypothetical protein [Planctomycetota bacterium]
MVEPALGTIHGRHDMVRRFDGYVSDQMEELDERKLKRPLVKTFLLELLNGVRSCTDAALKDILARRHVSVSQIEEGLFLAADGSGQEMGIVERLRPRILALYSTVKSAPLRTWVTQFVRPSPELDHVWLSGLTFGVLWGIMRRLSRQHRFTRLVFTHESIFDIEGQVPEEQEEEEEAPTPPADDDEREIVERRDTRVTLVDRISEIDHRLRNLQELYSPFYAISQLRFPSPVGRGGHDFFDDGQVTNRSESFRDHRSHVLFVVRIYERLLKSTEEQTWYSIRESVSAPGAFRRIVGAPVVIRFREPLRPEVFDYWVSATFERKRGSKFRLWGQPIRLGPTKVHVYGADRHLWQPLFLEFSAKGCIAIVPNGTCGNTVHRLVTNIQRYLDPGARTFIGDRTYEAVVEQSAEGVPYEPEG